MADLKTHYKENDPLQTVENIKEFFTKNNFQLFIEDLEEAESTTWYCHVLLYKNGIKIETANGKGVSKEYAMASGCAELYERFCNGMTFLANPYWVDAFTKENQKRYGYYFRKNEKQLTLDEWVHCCKRADTFFKVFANNNPDFIKTIADFITDGHYIGLPMLNIDKNEEPIYMDPRLLMRINHSIGMSGGNTVEEALVQGLSELVEKEGFDKFFKNVNEKFYAIKIENITDPVLSKIIDKLHIEGYDIQLVDLAYTFKIPVMMAILRDRKQGIFNINFGCFPVWEIAAERTLTEIYQGIKTYRDNMNNTLIRIPYKGTTMKDLYYTYSNSINGNIFPKSVFDNLQYVDSYNKEVYADKNSSNEDLLEYFAQLSKTLNCNFYYLDNSLDDKIHAVYTLIDSDDAYTNNEGFITTWQPTDVIMAIQRVEGVKSFYKKIMSDEKVTYLDCQKMVDDRFNASQVVLDFDGEVLMWSDFLLHAKNGCGFYNLQLFQTAWDDRVDGIPDDLNNSIILIPFKKYLTLIRYVKTNKYTTDEILDIFNNIFDFQVTVEDIQKCKNYTYLVNKAYVQPLRAYLYSDDYKEIINTFVINNNLL